MEFDTLTFYRSRFSRQWRWRYQAQGNGQKLANGGESYVDLSVALRSAFKVCGLPHPTLSLKRVYVDTLLYREDNSEVMVRFPPASTVWSPA